MSLQTWKEEFYPILAGEADYDPLVAAEHSLQKWIGMRKENLAKHDVVQEGQVIEDDEDMLLIDDTSCSLCQYSYSDLHGTAEGDCTTNCPLGALLGVCKEYPNDVNCCIEYHDGISRLPDPEPMISALERTVEMLKKPHEFPSQ